MPDNDNKPAQHLNAAEAIVIIALVVLVLLVAYFDLVSGKVTDSNQGYPTIVAAIFSFCTIKFLMKATRNYHDQD